MRTRIRIFAFSALIALAGLASLGAATTATDNIIISHYKQCELEPYVAEEGMAGRSATKASDWHIIGRCLLTYAGNKTPCFRLHKDEIAWGADDSRHVFQYGQKMCGFNDLTLRVFSSKEGYFKRGEQAHVKQSEVIAYYDPYDEGVWSPLPHGMMRYWGPSQFPIVDRDHDVCADGARWTSGYLIYPEDFTVVPDRLLARGAKCGQGSQVIYHGKSF